MAVNRREEQEERGAMATEGLHCTNSLIELSFPPKSRLQTKRCKHLSGPDRPIPLFLEKGPAIACPLNN